MDALGVAPCGWIMDRGSKSEANKVATFAVIGLACGQWGVSPAARLAKSNPTASHPVYGVLRHVMPVDDPRQGVDDNSLGSLQVTRG